MLSIRYGDILPPPESSSGNAVLVDSPARDVATTVDALQIVLKHSSARNQAKMACIAKTFAATAAGTDARQRVPKLITKIEPRVEAAFSSSNAGYVKAALPHFPGQHARYIADKIKDWQSRPASVNHEASTPSLASAVTEMHHLPSPVQQRIVDTLLAPVREQPVAACEGSQTMGALHELAKNMRLMCPQVRNSIFTVALQNKSLALQAACSKNVDALSIAQRRRLVTTGVSQIQRRELFRSTFHGDRQAFSALTLEQRHDLFQASLKAYLDNEHVPFSEMARFSAVNDLLPNEQSDGLVDRFIRILGGHTKSQAPRQRDNAVATKYIFAHIDRFTPEQRFRLIRAIVKVQNRRLREIAIVQVAPKFADLVDVEQNLLAGAALVHPSRPGDTSQPQGKSHVAALATLIHNGPMRNPVLRNKLQAMLTSDDGSHMDESAAFSVLALPRTAHSGTPNVFSRATRIAMKRGALIIASVSDGREVERSEENLRFFVGLKNLPPRIQHEFVETFVNSLLHSVNLYHQRFVHRLSQAGESFRQSVIDDETAAAWPLHALFAKQTMHAVANLPQLDAKSQATLYAMLGQFTKNAIQQRLHADIARISEQHANAYLAGTKTKRIENYSIPLFRALHAALPDLATWPENEWRRLLAAIAPQ